MRSLIVAGLTIILMAMRLAAPATADTLRQLTPALLQRIIHADQRQGEDKPLNRELTIDFGITKGNERIAGRQISASLHPGSIIFNMPDGNVDGYIFGAVVSTGTFIFYVDKNLTLIAAAEKLTGKALEVVAASDENVRYNLAVTFDRWALEARDLPP